MLYVHDPTCRRKVASDVSLSNDHCRHDEIESYGLVRPELWDVADFAFNGLSIDSRPPRRVQRQRVNRTNVNAGYPSVDLVDKRCPEILNMRHAVCNLREESD